jgi:hypothetical protein
VTPPARDMTKATATVAIAFTLIALPPTIDTHDLASRFHRRLVIPQTHSSRRRDSTDPSLIQRI